MLPYFRSHRARQIKVHFGFMNASYSFVRHKAQWIIRRKLSHMLNPIDTKQTRNQEGAFACQKISKYCIVILTFVETFKE